MNRRGVSLGYVWKFVYEVQILQGPYRHVGLTFKLPFPPLDYFEE